MGHELMRTCFDTSSEMLVSWCPLLLSFFQLGILWRAHRVTVQLLERTNSRACLVSIAFAVGEPSREHATNA